MNQNIVYVGIDVDDVRYQRAWWRTFFHARCRMFIDLPSNIACVFASTRYRPLRTY